MVRASTVFAGLLFLGALALLDRLSGSWTSKLWGAGAVVYAGVLCGAGMYYIQKGSRIAGFVHAALLLTIAGFGLVKGIGILADRSIMGGRGPDANSMAGVVYGIGLLFALVGGLAGIFAASSIWQFVQKKDDGRPDQGG